MNPSPAIQPARLPPAGLADLDPSWSRLAVTVDDEGRECTWHLLDSWADRAGNTDGADSTGSTDGTESPDLTLLCVHGNPTWSYLWRRLVAAAPPNWRVIAPDQLEMGFSQRSGRSRRLATRIDDLWALTAAVGVTGPVVTVAHDWGGPVSLGWALRANESTTNESAATAGAGSSGVELAGVVLTNTAVTQPPGASAPTIIRGVRNLGLLGPISVSTTGFIDGALAMASPRITGATRQGFLAPYRRAADRHAIRFFVEDIPLEDDHPTHPALDAVAEGIRKLPRPALMLWGPSDPVFSDLYLDDLLARMPHADQHRFVGASHLVTEEAAAVPAIVDWITANCTESDALPSESTAAAAPTASPSPSASEWRPMWAGLRDVPDPEATAVVEMGAAGPVGISFAELAADADAAAAGLAGIGVQPGARVALLVPPGIDLVRALNGCWLAGATVVIVDAGLGPKGMSHALRSAGADFLIGVDRAVVAARTLGWPGTRILVDGPDTGARGRAAAVAGGVEHRLAEVIAAGRDQPMPNPPGPQDLAAVVFTSGATGPAKGVRYRHHQISAQRDALVRLYGITAADRLVAAFAPFALYGPAMGIPSVVPAMDVTAPATLTAAALADAVDSVDASLVFASPAALVNVLATADVSPDRFEGVRLLLSAGAPVPGELLASMLELMPNAEAHTPYGMTECLPVADISLEGIRRAGPGPGVCVGPPVPETEVAIHPLGAVALDPDLGLTTEAGVVGEIVVRANHMKDGYDKLWITEAASSSHRGWHRTGDVGQLDDEGRLWVGGRLGHVITTADGPVVPVPIERRVEALDAVSMAAAVGVGPPGTQQVVVVVATTTAPLPFGGLASADLTNQVRRELAAATDPLLPAPAAVLEVRRLPVDIRHNSKIDRTRVAHWAHQILAGARARRL